MKPRAWIAGILLLSFALPGWTDDAPPKPVTVPFELLKTKHLAVMIKINGKGPYRVIFDTGAPVTLISNSVAKESGMLPKDARPPAFALFGAMGQFPIQRLEVGDLKAEKLPAVVMDHPAITALSRQLGPIEGIVGFPFFARYTMTLDYQAREFTFVPNGYEPADILETLMATIVAGKAATPNVLAPAGQWGVVVGKAENDEDAGVNIEEVRPGSAAAAAGLKAGDRLLSIDGRWTDAVLDCYHAVTFVKPGATAPLVIQRDGKEKKLTLQPRSGL